MKKFWMVLKNTGRYEPLIKHETKELAIEEADRLCRKENKKMFILETIGFVEPAPIPTTYSVEFEEGINQ